MHERLGPAHIEGMTSSTLIAGPTLEPVLTLDRFAAWGLLGLTADDRPLSIDVDGSPLVISVAHTRAVEQPMGPHPLGVLLLPVGVESNQAAVLVSGVLSVTYGDVHRDFSWEPGAVSDTRWDVAEFIEEITP